MPLVAIAATMTPGIEGSAATSVWHSLMNEKAPQFGPGYPGMLEPSSLKVFPRSVER
jgi:hypothetical protein